MESGTGGPTPCSYGLTPPSLTTRKDRRAGLEALRRFGATNTDDRQTREARWVADHISRLRRMREAPVR